MNRLVFLSSLLVVACGSGPSFQAAPVETGDASGSGGATGTGGRSAGSGDSGGVRASGGAHPGSGGSTATGGASSTGGAATGGTSSTGGAPSGGSAGDVTGSDGGIVDACVLVTHDNGLGQTWQDCVPRGTYNLDQAMKACAASGVVTCTANPVSPTCGGTTRLVWRSTGSGLPLNGGGWGYAGSIAGYVNHAQAPCTGPSNPDNQRWN